MSDINNRILYILEVEKNEENRTAHITSIAEFLLPSPFLSFCIIEATKNKCRLSRSSIDIYDEDDEDFDEDINRMMITINMYTIQPKKLQGCFITFFKQGESSFSRSYNITYEIPMAPEVKGKNRTLFFNLNTYLNIFCDIFLDIYTETFLSNCHKNYIFVATSL